MVEPSSKDPKERVIHEIYIHPTKWNQTKVFFANCYEAILIGLGLALSIYKDDIISLIYQIFMQVLLYYSMK